ncbi:MAG: S49 family peptidase [Burkholderiaceae bacterium]|nr:S49 family peptidase [Burkholderiaceae bacterium]
MSEQIDENEKTDAKPKNEGWERDVLEKLVFATLKEQRMRRRWSIFFRCAILAIAIFSIWQFMDLRKDSGESYGRHTALIEIDGVIDANQNSATKSLIPALNNAFSDKGSVGVILRINSPGGSPVQAGLINDEIRRLRQAYPDKPLYVVVHEICASGGYYVAAAADKIYVNKASIVGSIGVLINGFGFTGAMEKLGIERRLMIAGENKGFLDPFSPQSEKQKVHAQGMLNEIHQQFIDVVRTGRGNRLKETPEMFSGLFWSGSKAIELGLADDFGSVDSVARDVLKADQLVDYTEHEGLRERVLKKFGAAVGAGVVKSLWNDAAPVLR